MWSGRVLLPDTAPDTGQAGGSLLANAGLGFVGNSWQSWGSAQGSAFLYSLTHNASTAAASVFYELLCKLVCKACFVLLLFLASKLSPLLLLLTRYYYSFLLGFVRFLLVCSRLLLLLLLLLLARAGSSSSRNGGQCAGSVGSSVFLYRIV